MATSYSGSVFEMLTERLSGHGGAVMPWGVCGDARVVRAAGKRDVVVAMRAAAVSMKDVEDFERQVAAADGHGIMCNAVGKVARRDAVDFRQLSSGGYVWYLAVGYDVGAVVGLVGETYGQGGEEGLQGGEGERRDGEGEEGRGAVRLCEQEQCECEWGREREQECERR